MRRGDADATGATAEGERESGDVLGYVPTPEDLRLREVYGDWVHGTRAGSQRMENGRDGGVTSWSRQRNATRRRVGR